jgi:hypothetical protein
VGEGGGWRGVAGEGGGGYGVHGLACAVFASFSEGTGVPCGGRDREASGVAPRGGASCAAAVSAAEAAVSTRWTVGACGDARGGRWPVPWARDSFGTEELRVGMVGVLLACRCVWRDTARRVNSCGVSLVCLGLRRRAANRKWVLAWNGPIAAVLNARVYE